jgi:hypothetical protein
MSEPDPNPADIDLLLLPVALELLECLCTALNLETNPPGICCLRAGDSVTADIGQYYDECCQGLAWVRPAGFYMTGTIESPFPSPSTDASINACGIPAWGLQLEMGVLRCVKTQGLISCTEWNAAVIQQLADAKAMRKAVCCMEQLHDPGDVAVGAWTPVGPAGGCLGSTWAVSVQVSNICEVDCGGVLTD